MAYKPNVVNEYIFVFQKPAPFLIDKLIRSYTGKIKQNSLVNGEYEKTNIWYINPETRSKHPAPYPYELCEKLIRYYSYIGDTVFDPFMGSGTTAIAANNLNRLFVGIEIHKEFLDMAEERLSCKSHKNGRRLL